MAILTIIIGCLIDETVAKGVGHHRAGRLSVAEAMDQTAPRELA